MWAGRQGQQWPFLVVCPINSMWRIMPQAYLTVTLAPKVTNGNALRLLLWSHSLSEMILADLDHFGILENNQNPCLGVNEPHGPPFFLFHILRIVHIFRGGIDDLPIPPTSSQNEQTKNSPKHPLQFLYLRWLILEVPIKNLIR
jgi:hypothetical protein